MLSLPLLVFAPSVFSESKRLILTSCLPRRKFAILINRSASERRFLRRMKFFGHKNVIELSRVYPAFEGNVVLDCGGEKAGAIFRRKGWALKGFEATLNCLSKWLVAALFGLVIIWKHDAEAMWAAMGSVVNAWLSTILKQVLNQERPSALRSDPGMPSSHAQSIFYALVFAVLSLTRTFGFSAFSAAVGIITMIFGSYLSWLRVSQQLHTVNQVAVGAAIGSACSITWFWVWHSFVLRAFTSSIFVRILVVLGSVSFCATFLVYVVKNWLEDE